MRFRAGERDKCKLRLEEARKGAVTVQETSQVAVKGKFRAETSVWCGVCVCVCVRVCGCMRLV